ncbi:hypothetical protein JOE33_003241 [Pseudomonas sp. PvP027]|nr:hypothetical protein [Pseudomonas sp. PvP027]
MHADAAHEQSRNKHFPPPAVKESSVFIDPANALFAGGGHNAIRSASHLDAG